MLWWKRLYNRWLRTVAGVLLAIVFFEAFEMVAPEGLFKGLITEVFAAQVTIDSTVSTAQSEHTLLGSAVVFTTDQTGYRFYVNSTGVCAYSKTINGGANWSTEVTIDSKTNCFGVSVWYDRWTPGDNGSYIHILTADPTNNALWYNRLDTTDDTRLLAASPVNVGSNTGQTGTIAAGANAGSITKGTDGTIYMAMNDNTDSYVVQCSLDCGVTTNWTETGTNPMDAAADWSLLMPLPDGDILLINRDISADDMRSKVWDDSAGSWSGSWTTIDGAALENATYDPAFSATVDTTTGTVYLAYVNNETTGTIGGNNDDIKTATYSGGAWTGRGDILTNSALGVVDVKIGIDGNTSNIYASYVARTTPATATTGNVYWKNSTNGMVGWGVQQGPVNTSPDDIYGLSLNLFNFQRLFVTWYGITPDDLFGDTIADLVPVVEVSAMGLQNTEVRASSTDFYIGGKFILTEGVSSRNVTSVTLTESGTVNAASGLDNVELHYELDTSAPYNCASESFGGTEDLFGTTDTDGFSAANGTSTFTDVVSISTTSTMCLYAVVDVTKSAGQGDTIKIGIANPETDVLISGGATTIPNYGILLSGDTIVKLDTDFRIQRGISTMTGDTLTITAGVDYEAPASATSAFIRITNTGYTGAGRDSGGGTSNADDTTVYITNPENILNSITFQRGSGAINNTRISWEIIEYKGVAGGENEIIVRQQEDLSYVSGNTTLTSGAISGIVTDADVVVFITGQYNANTGASNYHRGFSTAAWNSGPDTVTFTRGGSGNVSTISYAVVEFTGSNWNIQRAQHTYTAVGSTETESITAVGSLTRTFLHVQKRFPASTHANFGHEVWLSGIGQISFLLDSAAATPASHVSVAWVIENTQTNGTPMNVLRSNGTLNTAGTAPQTNNVTIGGGGVDDLSVSSLFVNNRSDTNTTTWPEPIMGARLISTTQYELWRSDIGANIAYRTEVVEWPTAERELEQNYFRLYVDNNALTPTDPWPAGPTNLGENTEMTADDVPLEPGDQVRIRMSVAVSGSALPATADAYNLEYAEQNVTCSAVTTWFPIGDPSSTTAAWRGVNNTPVAGTALSADPPTPGGLLLSVSTVAGTYEEANSSADNPYLAFPGDNIEYDWVVEHNDAADKTSYCFRMVESDGTEFQDYNYYPVVRTVGYEPLITNWRWYDDETNLTPSNPRGDENVSPSNIENQNALKLRLVLQESSAADGVNVKFALQYSEYADFSQGVTTLTSTTTCTGNSLWCYFDGAGTDNAGISTAVISNADACVSGAGDGCGTYNEGVSTTSATVDHAALTNAEFEFTILPAGARVNTVYYFRLFNLTYNEPVGVADTYSYPSLVTEGALLTFTVSGLNNLTTTAGIITDATTTPVAIPFGSVPFNTNTEAAQRISINTNATEGFQVLLRAGQQLMNQFGDEIPPITSTNASPVGWSTACLVTASGCFGYHTTDASLDGGSTRFAPTDSYAALSTTFGEVMYSSIPASDVQDIVYKIKVTEDQIAGDYTTDITYVAVPVH